MIDGYAGLQYGLKKVLDIGQEDVAVDRASSTKYATMTFLPVAEMSVATFRSPCGIQHVAKDQ
jgi:hypothetical protein